MSKEEKKPISDNVIYLRLKQKDKEAFTDAYDKYIDDIYRFIFFKVGQKEEAEDLSSQVFLKTWNHIQNNSITDYKTLKSLLYKVARNLIIDHYRKKSNHNTISLDAGERVIDIPDTSQDTHRRLEVESEFESLSESLRLLKDEYREVIMLRYVNELSIKEIAGIVDKSKSNVRVILYRAMKALKETVKD